MNKKIIYSILGPGVSGIGAAKLLKAMNEPCLVIGNQEVSTWESKFSFLDEMSVCLNEEDARVGDLFNDLKYLILSPGIPRTHNLVESALRAGIKVVNEIDLAATYLSRESKGDEVFIGVTGSNGKTTTVTLINHLLSTAGKNTFLGGNIGTPLSSYVAEGKRADVYILELSSFQLETLTELKLNIGAWLNFTPTHEERYKCVNDYFSAKEKIFNLSEKKLVGFDVESLDFESSFEPKEFISPEKSDLDNLSLKNWKLKGEHNIENLTMAVFIAKELGFNDEQIQAGIDSFSPLDYRVQFIGSLDGSNFFNDSKSTNIESTKKAVSGFDSKKLTLLMGGKVRDESLVNLQSWKNVIENIDQVIIFGEAARFFKKKVTSSNCLYFDSFSKVRLSTDEKKDILFSPGFPSFDEFKNYIERGEAFNNFFENLKNK